MSDAPRPPVVLFAEMDAPFTGLHLGSDMHLAIFAGGKGLTLELTPLVARALARGLLELADRHELAGNDRPGAARTAFAQSAGHA